MASSLEVGVLAVQVGEGIAGRAWLASALSNWHATETVHFPWPGPVITSGQVEPVLRKISHNQTPHSYHQQSFPFVATEASTSAHHRRTAACSECLQHSSRPPCSAYQEPFHPFAHRSHCAVLFEHLCAYSHAAFTPEHTVRNNKYSQCALGIQA